MTKIRNIYRSLKLMKALIDKEKNTKIKTNPMNRLKMLSKGFLGYSNIMYQLDSNNYKDYLSDYKQMFTGEINGEDKYILNNKVVFEQMNKNYIRIPKSLAKLMYGKIMAINSSVSNVDDLMHYLMHEEKVIIKPISGSQGKGVFTVTLRNSKLYIDDNEVDRIIFEKRIKELNNYFISEYIKQGDFASQLYPDIVNSMRILTIIDPQTNEPFIAAAVQRIGTKQSEPTDNFAKGGLSAEIDLETGILSKGATYPFNKEMRWYDKHPDTGYLFYGLKVPHWEKIKDKVLYLARKNPELKYVGWDLVLTNDDVMVMEGNSWSDVNVYQIHKPLLVDNRIKDFYKYYDII